MKNHCFCEFCELRNTQLCMHAHTRVVIIANLTYRNGVTSQHQPCMILPASILAGSTQITTPVYIYLIRMTGWFMWFYHGGCYIGSTHLGLKFGCLCRTVSRRNSPKRCTNCEEGKSVEIRYGAVKGQEST